jgi:hypothetical protein
MVFTTTFNNISVIIISWRSVLLVEETGVPRENLLQVIDKLYHILPRSTQRKPPTCYKSLTNFITYCHGVPRENHQPVTSHWQTLSHIATEYPEKTTNLSQVIDKHYHILPRSTQRKPPTCYKSLTNFITYCHERGSNNFIGDRHWLHR